MLIAIALLCCVITAMFTIGAALTTASSKGQSVRGSLTEAWTNILIGFGINYCANLVVLPLAGLPISHGGAFWIGCIFTAISVLRSFFVRRAFNYWYHTGVFK